MRVNSASAKYTVHGLCHGCKVVSICRQKWDTYSIESNPFSVNLPVFTLLSLLLDSSLVSR